MAKPGQTINFTYDPTGMRASKAVGGVTTTYLLDGDSVVREVIGGVAKDTAIGGAVSLNILDINASASICDKAHLTATAGGIDVVADALARVARELGAAILVTEHKTAILARLADEVVVLDGGRVERAGPTADVLADPRLEALGVEPPAAEIGRAHV